MKKLSPDIKLRIVNLSKCFWFWDQFYIVYSSILWISKRNLELKFPRTQYNKFKITELILDLLEERLDEKALQEVISYFYKLDKPFDKDKNSHYTHALEELNEFKKVVWKDVIEEHVNQKEFTKQIEQRKKVDQLSTEKSKNITTIKEKFFDYIKAVEQKEKQERGFWLEDAFYKLLELEWIDYSPPYKTETEQIDWKFSLKTFDYLVEVKWTDASVKQQEISIFEWKLKRKWQSTRWFILSVNWFDESAVLAASWDSPRMIFMDASDFIGILQQTLSFSDIFSDKEDKLVRFWKVYK